MLMCGYQAQCNLVSCHSNEWGAEDRRLQQSWEMPVFQDMQQIHAMFSLDYTIQGSFGQPNTIMFWQWHRLKGKDKGII